MRARAVGVDRTAEELGRAFPGSPVVVPRPRRAAPRVPPGALVVATPGLEPPADGGYAAAVLLDGGVLLERADLRAGEEALRRWTAAAALVRPPSAGGRVVVCADAAAGPVQALIRADPGGFADRELAEREALGFPPAVALATVTGDAHTVARFAALLTSLDSDLGSDPDRDGLELLGPVPVEGPSQAAHTTNPTAESLVRLVVRVPAARRSTLTRRLREAAAARSAHREPGQVRVVVDPHDLG